MKKTGLPIAVFVSGNGSNLQAIIDAIEAGELSAEIKIVISDKADAFALKRCERHSIRSKVLILKDHPSKEAWEDSIAGEVAGSGARLVCLAGFMRILSPKFVRTFKGRLINIHPALLPNFKGLHAQRQAIEAKAKESGCTVHFVNENVDSGDIIAQVKVKILPGDTEEALSKRILGQEHKLYPKVIQMFADGRIPL